MYFHDLFVQESMHFKIWVLSCFFAYYFLYSELKTVFNYIFKKYRLPKFPISGVTRAIEYWVQGTRDTSSIWRYHDGTNMSNVMTNYIYYYGDYLLLSLHTGNLLGDKPDMLLPFICENRLT